MNDRFSWPERMFRACACGDGCGSSLVRAAAALLPIAAAALLLTGCMSAPVPAGSNVAWVPPQDARTTNGVWSAVRAQAVDFTRLLSLAELTDIALRNNPASRAAWSEARAAAAHVEEARATFMPTVTATAEASRRRTAAEPSSFDQDYLKYGPGLDMSYLVLNFGGGRKAAVEAALQTVYAADYSFNRAIQDTLFSVEVAYYGLVSAQAGIEAAEASVKDATTALDVAQERAAAGVGTQLDVLQAQARHDQSLYGLASAQGAFKTARGGLAQAIGVPADAPLQVVAPSADVPAAPASQDVQRMIDDALSRRPDIAALSATLAAAESAAKGVASTLWPSLYLNADLSRDAYETMGGSAFQDDDWSFGGGLSLQWTVFDGYLTRSSIRAAQARADSARALLQQAELAASAAVWSGYQNYATALEKHRFSTAYLKSASATYDLALDSYKAGLTSILDLLTAESQLAQARSQSIAARQEVFTALANLAYATGLLEKGGADPTRDLFSTPMTKESQP